MVFLKDHSARNRWLVGVGGLLAVSSLAAAVLVVVRDGKPQTLPPVADQTLSETLEYLTTKEFAAQPAGVRDQYIRQAMEAGVFNNAKNRDSPLTDAQWRQLKRNIASTRRDMTDEKIKEYFELPPEQRVAYLDKIIDGKKKNRRDRKDGGRGGDRNGIKGFTPEALKHVLEHLPAEERSRHLEFKRAWMERMRERGIEPW